MACYQDRDCSSVGSDLVMGLSMKSKKSELSNNLDSCDGSGTQQDDLMSESSRKQEGLSEYELQIQRNIEERKKLFKLLQLGDAKRQLAEVLNINPSVNQKAAPSQNSQACNAQVRNKGLQKIVGKCSTKISGQSPVKKHKDPIEPLQMALRERKVQPFYCETIRKSEPLKTINGTTRKRVRKDEALHPKADSLDLVTLSGTFADQGSLEESISFVDDMNETMKRQPSKQVADEKGASKDFVDFNRLMQTFELGENGAIRMTRSNISSLAWHPNPHRLLLAAGDLYGTVCFWDCDHQIRGLQRILPYNVFTSQVVQLSFDTSDPFRLFCTGTDCGRLLDFRTGLFDVVCSVGSSSRISLTHHAQIGPFTLLFSQNDGKVSVVDIRVPFSNQTKWKIDCFPSSIPMLNRHPLDDHLFVACSEKKVAIFDLRRIGQNFLVNYVTEPILIFPTRSAQIRGAQFSPVTGNHVLTMGENLFEVFAVQESVNEANCVASLNFKYLQKKQPLHLATWHPTREDVIFIGGMDNPYRIEMLSLPNGQTRHIFQGDLLSHECCITAFHPSVDALAAGGSVAGHGRVHLFRPPT